MTDRLAIPGTDDLCRFVEAYFAGTDWEKDIHSKAGHIVYRIPGHHRNISIPRGRDRLVRPTFFGILRDDIGIEVSAYRELAGTRAKLNAYCKSRRRDS